MSAAGPASAWLPPAWLLAALALPVLWTAVLLSNRPFFRAVTTTLWPQLPSQGLVVFFALPAAVRLCALLVWALHSGASSPGAVGAPPSPGALLARLLLGVPTLAAGAALCAGAVHTTGVSDLCYSGLLLAGHTSSGAHPHWPYTLTAHPWDLGAALCAVGAVALWGRGPDAGMVALLWAASHLAIALVEEGLAPPLAPAAPRRLSSARLLTWDQGRNPFYDVTMREGNGWEGARRKLMTPLAVLRSLCFWGGLVVYGLFVNAVFYCVRDERQRHAVLVPTTRAAASLVLWLCGFSVRVTGWERLHAARESVRRANGSFVVVVNHISYQDILVLSAVLGPYAAAARHDLLSWPIVGPLARSWGVVGVVQSSVREKELASSGVAATTAGRPQAGSGTQGVSASTFAESLASITSSPGRGTGGAEAPMETPSRGAAAVLAARARVPGSGSDLPPVLVFPEGTTTQGGCLVAFRSGAFVAGVPCLPVTLQYSRPSGESESWIAPHSTGAHFWRSMCAWGKAVDVHILPLHVPSRDELADAAVYASSVRTAMATDLGVQMLDSWTVRDAHQLNADLARAAVTGLPVAIHKHASA